MKFDYIIMNPPYNDVNGTMLHYKFLCKALEVAETVVSIQPATWMNQQKNRAGLPLNGRGATINIIQDTEHLFGDSNTNLGYNLSVSCFSSKYNDIRVDWGNGERTVYQDLESLSTLDKNSILKNIISKGDTLSDDKQVGHVYGYAGGASASGSRIIRDTSVLKGKWIVRLMQLIPMRERHPNNFGYLNINSPEPSVYQHSGDPSDKVGKAYHIFDTEREARNCYAYLASDLIRAYAIAYKVNSAVVQNTSKYIPWPATFDTDPALWTNEAVSDRAGLDETEREWLREMLPDCYNIRKPAVPHGAAGRTRNLLKSPKA